MSNVELCKIRFTGYLNELNIRLKSNLESINYNIARSFTPEYDKSLQSVIIQLKDCIQLIEEMRAVQKELKEFEKEIVL